MRRKSIPVIRMSTVAPATGGGPNDWIEGFASILRIDQQRQGPLSAGLQEHP